MRDISEILKAFIKAVKFYRDFGETIRTITRHWCQFRPVLGHRWLYVCINQPRFLGDLHILRIRKVKFGHEVSTSSEAGFSVYAIEF